MISSKFSAVRIDFLGSCPNYIPFYRSATCFLISKTLAKGMNLP